MNFSTSPPNSPGDQRRRNAPVRVEHGSDLGRRRALGEAREPHEVAEENADVLLTLPRRRQIEVPESLVAPFATRGEANDQVRRDDQAVPLPPARMPLALPGDRDPDHRLGQQQEAGDDGHGEQVPAVPEDAQ